MNERTEAEKKAIVDKVCDTMGVEALILRKAGNKNASKAILEYLSSNDEESFIRLYDIMREV